MIKTVSIVLIFTLLFGLLDQSLINLYNVKSLVMLPSNKLNTQFTIVASIKETNSKDDIVNRPIYDNKNNQYFLKRNKNNIYLMKPVIGIKYSNEYNITSRPKKDRILMKFPIHFVFFNRIFFDINKLVEKKFLFKEKDNIMIHNKLFRTNGNVLNFDIGYTNKNILYSFYFHQHNDFKKKIASIHSGYFLVLEKIFDIYGSKQNHYITKWDDTEIKVFIDKTVPKEFIKTFKDGIEEWNNAFEHTGNKVRIRGISYLDNDWVNFIPGDARYTTISLSPSISGQTYAVGQFDYDLRNGRIFRGNIMVSNKWIDYWGSTFEYIDNIRKINLLKIGNCKSIKESKKYKLDFIKKGIKSVVVHEVGHILGLRHNFKASSLIKYDEIFNKKRIIKDGLIPSIMDYFNYAINLEKVIRCISFNCLFSNIEIMTTIGGYDKEAILYGYGNKDISSYYLGSDEMVEKDSLSNTGDISDSPSLYYRDQMNISKYIIENLHLIKRKNGLNLEKNWKLEIEYLKNNFKMLKNSVEICINIITSLSYNFNGQILNTKNSQIDCIYYLVDLFEERFKPNKISLYFDYDKCGIEKNYYCYGMNPIDYDNFYRNNLNQIKYFFESNRLQEKILYNNKISQNKTISREEFIKIFNN